MRRHSNVVACLSDCPAAELELQCVRWCFRDSRSGAAIVSLAHFVVVCSACHRGTRGKSIAVPYLLLRVIGLISVVGVPQYLSSERAKLGVTASHTPQNVCTSPRWMEYQLILINSAGCFCTSFDMRDPMYKQDKPTRDENVATTHFSLTYSITNHKLSA